MVVWRVRFSSLFCGRFVLAFPANSASRVAHLCSASLFDLLPSSLLPFPLSHAKVSGRVYLIMNRWVSA